MRLSTFAIPLAFAAAVASAASPHNGYSSVDPHTGLPQKYPVARNTNGANPAFIEAILKANAAATRTHPSIESIRKMLNNDVNKKVQSFKSTIFNSVIPIPKQSETFWERIVFKAHIHKIGVNDVGKYLPKVFTTYNVTKTRAELKREVPQNWIAFIPQVDELITQMTTVDFGNISGNLLDTKLNAPVFKVRPPPVYLSKAALIEKANSDLVEKTKNLQTAFSLNPFSHLVAKPQQLVTLWDKVLLQANVNGISTADMKYLPRIVESAGDDRIRDDVVRGEPKTANWVSFDSSFLNILRKVLEGKFESVDGNVWDSAISTYYKDQY